MYTFLVLFVACTAAYGAIWHFESDKADDSARPSPAESNTRDARDNPGDGRR